MFQLGDYGGPFFGRTGLECTAIPALIELVLFVVTMMQLDRLHGDLTANPHSLLGEALRKQGQHEPPPPPTRVAWDGQWEDPDKAADKMRADR